MYLAPSGSQIQNFTHMFQFQDYKDSEKVLSKKEPSHGSMMWFIATNPNTRRMQFIIEKAQMVNIFSNPQANFTFFVPLDQTLPKKEEFYTFMDVGSAKQIVNSALLNYKMDKKLLTSSPVCYFNTLNTKNRMFITTICDKTIINDCVQVLDFDIKLNNGIIHITDSLIIPSDNTFIN